MSGLQVGQLLELQKHLADAQHSLAGIRSLVDGLSIDPVDPSAPVEPGPKSAPPLRMSDAGKEYLAALEGCELKAYRDIAGIWTIGVGHVIRDGEEWMHGGITKIQAMGLLDEDVRWAEEAVHSLGLDRPLEQHELDALTCFCFNVGARAFKGSTMARKLKAGDYDCVPSELMRWIYYTDHNTGQKKVSRGLKNRRHQTGELWIKGDYTITW